MWPQSTVLMELTQVASGPVNVKYTWDRCLKTSQKLHFSQLPNQHGTTWAVTSTAQWADCFWECGSGGNCLSTRAPTFAEIPYLYNVKIEGYGRQILSFLQDSLSFLKNMILRPNGTYRYLDALFLIIYFSLLLCVCVKLWSHPYVL